MKAHICPSGKLYCLLNAKAIQMVYEGHLPNFLKNWANTRLHLLLLIISVDYHYKLGAVVVAQLVEWLLLTKEVHGLNPVIANLIYNQLY